mgnify:CR=1 FL=1
MTKFKELKQFLKRKFESYKKETYYTYAMGISQLIEVERFRLAMEDYVKGGMKDEAKRNNRFSR